MPAAVLATAVLLAGCSNADTTAEPTGKSGGDQTATASVDPAALDTGSYPTSPAPEFGRATQETILDVDGQRLAEFTVVPFEIDPELTSVKMPTMVMRSGKNLGVVLSDAAGDIAHNHQMLYGYVSTAATPTTKTTDPSLVRRPSRDAVQQPRGRRRNRPRNPPEPAHRRRRHRPSRPPKTSTSCPTPWSRPDRRTSMPDPRSRSTRSPPTGTTCSTPGRKPPPPTRTGPRRPSRSPSNCKNR